MKRTLFVLLAFNFILLLVSCQPHHYSLRFKNNFKEEMDNVVAGSAVFGTVMPGQTTGYLTLTSRSFLISGMSVSGTGLSSSGAVSGSGTHKWTITLTTSGAITITKDS